MAHLRAMADDWDCSLSDAVGRLVREEVDRRVEGGGGRVGPRFGLSAVPDGGGGGDVSGGVREGGVGVGAGDVAVAVVAVASGYVSSLDDVLGPIGAEVWVDPAEGIA